MSDTRESRTGYYQLSWQISGPPECQPEEFVLAETRNSETASSNQLFASQTRASFLSGKSDGTYRYRLQAVMKYPPQARLEASEIVKVRHYSLLEALLYFGTGVIVFGATVFLIFHREVRR